MPKISIVTPIYNSEKYLNRCISSILTQTFSDFELILVDDGSPDNCPAMCDEWALKDTRIKVLHQKNQGQAAARNNALDMAQGEYFAFIDSDDWVHPKYLEILYSNAKNNNADISVCMYKKVSDEVEFNEPNSIETYSFCGREYLTKSLTGEIGYGVWLLWDKLFRRECWTDIRMPEGRINEDNATVYKILYEANTVVACDDVLYYYFQNENSTVNKAFNKRHLDWLLVPEEMIVYFTEKGNRILVDKCNKMYLSSLEDMLRKSQKYLNDRDIERSLLLKLKTQFKAERKKYPITIKTHPSLYEVLYPAYSLIYWTLNGIKKKLTKR